MPTEPYESPVQRAAIIIFGILIGLAAYLLGAGLWAVFLGFGFILFGLALWPSMVKAGQMQLIEDGGFIIVETLGVFPTMSRAAIPVSTDDASAPGKLLFAWGGGSFLGFPWRDGGSLISRGGYMTVSQNLVRRIGRGWYIPAFPAPTQKHHLLPHYQAAIDQHKWNPDYSDFYDAEYGLVSSEPSSEKTLERHASDLAKNALLSEMRDLTSDAEGFHASTYDMIQKSIGAVTPKPKRSILQPKEKPPEENPQNGD